MLQSSEAHYRQQQRYAAVAIAAARRAWSLGNPVAMLPALTVLQGHAARDGAASVGDILAEQNIDAPPVAEVATAALIGVASDGRPLGSLLMQAQSVTALETMAVTQVADTSRVAAGVAITTRPGVEWTRMVNPPCCARCAILAGKRFKWNQGFPRHPACDCRHIPTTEEHAGDVRIDPEALFAQGKVSGVTQAEQKAITAGADLNQVINARRSLFMDTAGHKMTREGITRHGIAGKKLGTSTGGRRSTPEQIYRDAGDDQDLALRLLKRFGYIL
jgi:hypothetical protein